MWNTNSNNLIVSAHTTEIKLFGFHLQPSSVYSLADNHSIIQQGHRNFCFCLSAFMYQLKHVFIYMIVFSRYVA